MTRRSAGGALAAGVVAVSAALARTHRVSAVEERLFRAANDRSDRIGRPVEIIMQSGALPAVFVVGAAVHRWGPRQRAVPIVIGGSVMWLGIKLAKLPIGRGRPRQHLDAVQVRGSEQTGLGYPSGHAAIATMLAMCATRRGPMRIVALTVAGLTGFSRMYVGAHLPLDIVGGVAIGSLTACLVDGARPNAPGPGSLPGG